MAEVTTADFRLTLPTEDEISSYGSQSVDDLHASFRDQFDRISPRSLILRRFVTTDTLATASLEPVGDLAELAPIPYKVFGDTKDLTIRKIPSLNPEKFYMGVLTLRSCYLSLKESSLQYAPESKPSIGVSFHFFVPDPVEIDRPGMLVEEFGIGDLVSIDDRVFDETQRGRIDIFNTGEVTANTQNSRDVDLAKRVFGVAIAAMEKMPDYNLSE